MRRAGNGDDFLPERSVSFFECFLEDMDTNAAVLFFFKIFFLRTAMIFISFLLSRTAFSLWSEILENL